MQQQRQQRQPLYAGTPKRRMERYNTTVDESVYNIQQPQQMVYRRKINKNIMTYLKEKQIVRHIYNGHYAFAILHIIEDWATDVSKPYLLPVVEGVSPDDMDEKLFEYMTVSHRYGEYTAFRSLSGFAVSHKNTIDPTKSHQANGWKECEILLSDGTWSSIARVYP
jgi:hypothetical protein